MTDTLSDEFRIDLIKKQKVFNQLNAQETQDLAALLSEKHFKMGDTLVNEGDVVDSILFIVEGRADVRHITIVDGKPKIHSLALLGPGQAVGINESGFYSLTGRRTASVVAVTDLVTLFLSMPRFHGFALAYPHVNELMRQKIIDQR